MTHVMKSSCIILTSAVVAVALAAPAARAGEEEHFDIWVHAQGNQIVTGSISEDGTPLNDIHYVFGAELGEDLLFPFSATEPGFQTDAAGFGSLTTLTFTILDSLRQWNGDGFDQTTSTMDIAYGPASVQTGAGPVAGFNFATDANGYMHDHFEFTLQGVADDPMPGIYLLSLSMSGVSPQYGASNPFYLVFNLGMSEIDHDLAIDWVQENLVPAPGALAVFSLLGLGGRRRRRRNSKRHWPSVWEEKTSCWRAAFATVCMPCHDRPFVRR